jgi:hypothetical protein
LHPGTILWTLNDDKDIKLSDDIFFYITPMFKQLDVGFHGDYVHEFEVVDTIICISPLFLHQNGRCFTYFTLLPFNYGTLDREAKLASSNTITPPYLETV